jgi:thiosulfate dehydrogenase [quinone] large subunit
MTRKEFIQKTGAFSALAALGAFSHCASDSGVEDLNRTIEIDLTDPTFAVLTDNNGWLLHPSENILLINIQGEIRAFSSVCPHDSCARNWTYQPGVFTCTCHSSKFDTQGAYLSGPANANLTEFPANREGDTLIIN